MRYPHKPTFSLYMLALEALGLKTTAAKLVEANDADNLVQAVILVRETCAGMPAPLPKLEDRKRQILVVLEMLAADLLRLSPPCYCDEGERCPVGRVRASLAPLERPEPEPLVPSAMAAEVAADAERLLEDRLAGLGFYCDAHHRNLSECCKGGKVPYECRFNIAGVRPGTPEAEAAAAATPGPVSVGYGSAWPRRLGDFANPNLGIPWPSLGAVDSQGKKEAASFGLAEAEAAGEAGWCPDCGHQRDLCNCCDD